MNFEKYVNETLDQLGIPCNLIGRQYLVEAIKEYRNSPNPKICQLYKDVAKVVNATSTRVERAIRHAIERGFDNCTPDEIYEYFGNTISLIKGRPTNGEFIARVNHMYDMEGDK